MFAKLRIGGYAAEGGKYEVRSERGRGRREARELVQVGTQPAPGVPSMLLSRLAPPANLAGPTRQVGGGASRSVQLSRPHGEQVVSGLYR